MLAKFLSFSAASAFGILVAPKIIFGHCIFHLLGISDALGFDPLHEVFELFFS